MTSLQNKPTARQMLIAVICLVIVLGGAFLAASLTQEKKIFSLSPPAEKNAPPNVQVPPDIRETQRLDLHRTFFTAWAALILVTPALCTFLFRRSSKSAAGYWLAFWTVSFIAFLVHFYWAIAVLFGEWNHAFDTTRVSAPRVDTVFTVWWGIDVLLAWLVQSEGVLIKIQRALVHLVAFVLFVAGSAVEGEIWWSKALGFTMAAVVLIACLISFVRWLKSRKPVVAPAA